MTMIANKFKSLLRKSATFMLTGMLIVGGYVASAAPAAAASIPVINNSFEEPGATDKEAAGWFVFGDGYKRGKQAHTGSAGITIKNSDLSQMSGAWQRVNLNQTLVKPVQIKGFVKGRDIKMSPGSWFGASLYAEIHLQDGSVAYWNSVPNFGTFNWRPIGFNTGTLASVNQPIDHIFVVPLLGSATGTAIFDDIEVKEFSKSEAAITVMYDDGEISAYTAALPLMDELGLKGAVAVISGNVGKDGFMNKEQLKELQSKNWEIVSHGITHSDLTAMSTTEAARELKGSKSQLERMGLTVNNFALPYGAYDMNLMALGSRWYTSLRPYELGSNPAGTLPWEVKVRSVTTATTIETIEAWLNEAVAKGQWVVLTFHTIDETGDDAYHTSPEELKAMLEAVKNSGAAIVTYDEGLSWAGGL